MLLFALTFVIPAAAQTVPSDRLLNPNLATEQELLALPHLNATLMRSVVAKRPDKMMLELNAAQSSLSAVRVDAAGRLLFSCPQPQFGQP